MASETVKLQYITTAQRFTMLVLPTEHFSYYILFPLINISMTAQYDPNHVNETNRRNNYYTFSV